MTTRAVHMSRKADTPGPRKAGTPGPRTSGTPGVREPSGPALGAWRKALRVVAPAAAVPYLVLKSAWLAGSRVGIPEGSPLLEPGMFLTVANAVTLAMDASVILLVLVLTRPWGTRVPPWLLTVPAFVATGLLTPILTAFPAQLLIRAAGLGGEVPGGEAARPFLDSWVFTVVYGGFTVQGLALAALFVPYARERWGRRWQGVLGRGLPSPTGVVAGAAAVGALPVAAVHAYWAFGGTAGLGAERAAASSTAMSVVSGVHAICALGAAVGAVLLARGGNRRAGWPLALTWTGSAAALAWGLWPLLASLGPQLDGGERPSAAVQLIYAGQMITGVLAAAVLTRFLTSRREG
ncbi:MULTISPECIES: hypothetical protein [unclassified Streptomyces]|uniref:hypothetical protein n=1 Tax=unclassified Streptomyces TaxID=2593676 RepID=UPI00225A6AC2|nr:MULTISPECIES: hypothetical protein [unclassified Streptomyces]MCX4525199.1 hypothetical protein [Streptomyces sp. NBC_01551]MCX4544289.1 hypothetical protein [Streptomyces sp. NBC_01565]